MSCLGANFVAVGVDTMLYTRRWTAGWRCLNPPAPSRRESELLTAQAGAGSGERLRQHRDGCSQRLLVDISICHLQVSQSVTTMSAPLSSICRNSGAPIAWDTA
jgi:hypothetical protein